MDERRAHRRDSQMRQRILAVAGRLFAERGYGVTSVRDIAKELGIANPSLYHHFASKGDLLAELLREPLERVGAATVEADRLNGDARTRRLVEGLLESLEVHSGIALAAMHAGGETTDAQRVLADAGAPDVAALLVDGAAEDRRDLRVVMAVGAVEAAVRRLMLTSPDADIFVRRLRAERDDIVDLTLVILQRG